MKTIYLSCWEDFETKIQELKPFSAHEFARFLFRGQEKEYWRLETTLEREWGKQYDLKEYYRAIYGIHGEIESITEVSWPIPSFHDALHRIEKITEYENRRELPASAYIAYLRHHGYPSPLLDWSFSPYVAAYFAFRKKPKGCEGRNFCLFRDPTW